MLSKLVGLPAKHVVGNFVTIAVAVGLAETLADLAYRKTFKLPLIDNQK